MIFIIIKYIYTFINNMKIMVKISNLSQNNKMYIENNY